MPTHERDYDPEEYNDVKMTCPLCTASVRVRKKNGDRLPSAVSACKNCSGGER